MHRALCILVPIVLSLGGCAVDAGVVSRADLSENPERYEGRTLTITGGVDARPQVNAAYCETLPCNNGRVDYFFGDVPVRASETFDGPLATGVHPQVDTSHSYDPTRFGCDGNDVEMVCAPAIPSAISWVAGRMVDGVFLVDDYELLDASPTVEPIVASAGHALVTLRTVGTIAE